MEDKHRTPSSPGSRIVLAGMSAKSTGFVSRFFRVNVQGMVESAHCGASEEQEDCTAMNGRLDLPPLDQPAHTPLKATCSLLHTAQIGIIVFVKGLKKRGSVCTLPLLHGSTLPPSG